MYKSYAANIKIKARETKVIDFPLGYFKFVPTITVTPHGRAVAFIKEINKKYVIITNNSEQDELYSFIAITGREQLIPDFDNDNIPDLIDTDIDGDNVANTQDEFPFDSTESADTDKDGIGNNADTDDDNDGISDVDEINYGSDPLDPNSVPAAQVASTLYFTLTTENTSDFNIDFLAIYSGEMFDLDYPQIIDLQPDADGGSHFEIVTPDDVTDKHNFDKYRVYSLNNNDYSNTSPKSAIFKAENLNKNQVYNLIAFNQNNIIDNNDPTTELSITLAASDDANENSSSILGNNTSNTLFNYDGNQNLTGIYYWIHNFSIGNDNVVTFNSSNEQLEPDFYYEAIAYLAIHSNYTQNSDNSNPDVEIAIQRTNFDANADTSSYAGYISQFEYTIQDIENQDDAFSIVTNDQYTAISTNLNSDSNTNNQSRVIVQTDVRQRFRVHVKVGQNTDCDFNININAIGMMDYFMNYGGDIDNYNADYNNNSNLNYYNLIPNDGNSNQRTYYYFFTVREDGFIIWEN